MKNKVLIARAIKNKRIALNLTSEQLAIKCGLSRSTIFSIETGGGNYSIDALFKVLDALALDIKIAGTVKTKISRERAKRINTKLDKDINRFIIMCVENYCSSKGKTSEEIYPLLKSKSVIYELEKDYSFFHSLSTELINDYIDAKLIDAR